MPSVQPVILSEAMACRAIADPGFYVKLPEFSGLRNQQKAIDARNAGGGCGGCRKRTLHTNLFRQFVNIASSLNDNGRNKLRQYMGAPSLMINTVDPSTNRIRAQII